MSSAPDILNAVIQSLVGVIPGFEAKWHKLLIEQPDLTAQIHRRIDGCLEDECRAIMAFIDFWGRNAHLERQAAPGRTHASPDYRQCLHPLCISLAQTQAELTVRLPAPLPADPAAAPGLQ